MDIIDDLNVIIDSYDEALLNTRRPYNSSNRYHHWDNLNSWDELEFYQRFRLTKDSTMEVLDLIKENLAHQSNRSNPIPPIQQLLLTLRFLATGSFYIAVGDFGAIHKSTVCKIVHKVVRNLASLRPRFISMPQSNESKFIVQRKFMNISRFPRVIGAIDCTHIKIENPGGHNAEVFRNRKGFFSLNVQAICDADNKFMDIVTRWPGSAHDSNIFDNSTIKHRFEMNEFGSAILLGDSGYPSKKYMMTPIQNPMDAVDALFNESQIRTRGIIERTFGIWKRRFPCLTFGLRCMLPIAQNVIVSTAVLHNMATGDIKNNIIGMLPDYLEEEHETLSIEDSTNVYRSEFLDYFRTLS